jgi:TonB-dependent Receptor Plug Domain
MKRSILCLLLALLAFRASADVLAVIVDQDLGTPLEGVQVRIQGIDQAFTTDDQGQVTLPAPPGNDRAVITAQLLGYKTIKRALTPGQDKITLEMELEGTVQGEGLVVEGAKPQATDAKGGLSQVVTNQDIQAQTMGIVEDAMAAIKTLPGVGYAGAFDSRPSINGGSPSETVATLDGAYILNPYQWEGAYTIFNPDMIDSIKLSDGIIGAPYGQVMSGLLEAASKAPADTDRHIDFGFSTTGLDLFYQQAFGGDAGVLLGGKVTWMSVPLALIDEGNLFSTAPYIRNGTAKFYWNPTPTLGWTLDANLDSDGVAISGIDTTAGPVVFGLSEKELLVSSTLKDLLNKDLLLNVLASYNSMDTESGFTFPVRDATGLSNVSNTSDKEYRYQLRASFDWTGARNQVISYGVDEMLENWSTDDSSRRYTADPSNPGQFIETSMSSNLPGMNTLSSGIFIDDEFTLIPAVLTGEGGLRVDHSFVYGGSGPLQTYPVPNPRIRLTYTFLKDWLFIRSMDVNAGTGLYSQFPSDNHYMDAKYGVASLEVGPTRAWFDVAGLDIVGTGGETMNIQGYYKYYLDRFYTATNATGGTVLKYDGTGFAYGADLGLKRQSPFWDLSFSYSFNITELYNPGGTGLSPSSPSSPPFGVTYVPSYEVEHTFYLDLTVKPNDGFSILAQATLASAPETSGASTATSTVDQTNWQYPVDVKLDWHGFYSMSKVRWEFYAGCQDVFALLYFIRPNSQATFNIGFPIPSVGYKLSF